MVRGTGQVDSKDMLMLVRDDEGRQDVEARYAHRR